jgi:predicted Rossmann fold nucleotide-binding protein DprA/Smf involved in DNA uptake
MAHAQWARIVASVQPFDIHLVEEASDGLAQALRRSGTEVRLSRSPRKRALTAAAGQAEEWLGRGVRVVIRGESGSLGDRNDDIPLVLFSRGELSFLDRPAAAVLNSRKPKKITPHDAWLRHTVILARYALGERLPLISSYGAVPYALVTFLGRGSPLITVCPEVLPCMQPRGSRNRFFQENAGLFLTRSTLFLSPFLPGQPLSRATRLTERDRVVGALAEVLLVADVRSGGNMETVLEEARKKGKLIVRGATAIESISAKKALQREPHGPRQKCGDTLCESAPGSRDEQVLGPSATKPKPSCACADGYSRQCPSAAEELPAGSRSVVSEVPDGVSFLVHYTRGCPGPWPGQTPGKYLKSLVESAPDAAHTAFDTLRRILEERLIRGSHRLTRGTTPIVSFTDYMPEELSKLPRWRTGLVRTWFEPYGIGLRREPLLRLGVERVVYGDESVYGALSPERKHLFQLFIPSGKDWSAEREWRLKGNLHLDDFGRGDVLVMVQTVAEAAILMREFDFPVRLSGGFGRSPAGLPAETGCAGK